MSDLVTIASFYTTAEAETLRAVLAEEGITAFVTDAEVASLNFLWTPAIGGVKLRTSTDDAERARAMIAAHGGYRYGKIDYDSSDGSMPCLACGTTIAALADACPQCGWSYELEHVAAGVSDETGDPG
jgi:hypothetical protein